MDTFRVYEKLSGSLGQEAAGQLAALLGDMMEELKNTVTKSDFSELKGVVGELAEAQRQTEQQVKELAEAQRQTEQQVKELAEAQRQTEQQVKELAEAQRRTEDRMEKGFRDIGIRFDVLGSRWGDKAERAFRAGLLESVEGLGFVVEHYKGKDPEGFINHRPGRTFDLDVLIHNGMTVVAEIKSNASGADVTEFARCAKLFEMQSGRKVDKAILVAVTIQQRARENAEVEGVVVATDFAELGA